MLCTRALASVSYRPSLAMVQAQALLIITLILRRFVRYRLPIPWVNSSGEPDASMGNLHPFITRLAGAALSGSSQFWRFRPPASPSS